MGSDSQTIEWGLAELLKENHKRVIFDLTQVTFLDSSGIGILMMCHAKLKRRAGPAYSWSARHGARNAGDHQPEQDCELLCDGRGSCAGVLI